MTFSEIYENQRTVCLSLSVHVNELCALTDGYLSGFEREDFFIFSGSEEQNRLYKKEYLAFVSRLPEIIAQAEAEVAHLSSLLVEADEAGELDAITLIGAKVEAYLAFERELGAYSADSRAAVTEERISPTRLVSAARRLRSAAEALIIEIQK